MANKSLEEPQSAELKGLMGNFRQAGKVAWIGLRPARKADLTVVKTAKAVAGKGLEGDRVITTNSAKRQVTLIMGEHLDTAASILGIERINPGLTRRNIVTRGINLMALRDKRFRIGTAVLELTSPCHPCTRMEENLGTGGFNAMRGHGGWCAIVVEGGEIHVGDSITAE